MGPLHGRENGDSTEEEGTEEWHPRSFCCGMQGYRESTVHAAKCSTEAVDAASLGDCTDSNKTFLNQSIV